MSAAKPPDRSRSALNWRIVLWGVLVWLLIGSLLRGLLPMDPGRTLTYTEFKRLVHEGRVTEVTLQGDDISGTAAPDPEPGAAGKGADPARKPATPHPFSTTMPPIQDPELLPCSKSIRCRSAR